MLNDSVVINQMLSHSSHIWSKDQQVTIFRNLFIVSWLQDEAGDEIKEAPKPSGESQQS